MGYALLLIFHGINCSHAIILTENAHSLQTQCSHAHILSKNRPISQKQIASCNFFLIFHEKIPAVMPIFGPENVNSVKTTLYYGPKMSIEYPFFQKKCPKIPYNNGQKSEIPLQNTL